MATKNKNSEYNEQVAVATYLSYQPLLWQASMVGANLTIQAAMKAKSAGVNKSFPDLLIFDPYMGYVGLAIEMKKLFWRPGEHKEREEEQEKILRALEIRNWVCTFGRGSDHAIKIIKAYTSEDKKTFDSLKFRIKLS